MSTLVATETSATAVDSRVFLDVTGRAVAVLAEGVRPAGWHEASWEATGLPSGVYVYRLDTPAQTLTRAMLLLK